MKPIKTAQHLEKLKKLKRDDDLVVIVDGLKYPKNVLDGMKENFESRKKLVEEFKEAKRNKVPGAKLGNANRGKPKDKEDNGNPKDKEDNGKSQSDDVVNGNNIKEPNKK